MKLAGLLALGLLCVPHASGAENPARPTVDRESVWFKPSLTVDASPVCAGLLRIELESFFSPGVTPDHEHDGFKKLRERHHEPIVADPQVLVIGESYNQQLRLTLPDQQTAFVHFLKYPGCGGACESEEVLVSDRQFDSSPSYRHDFPHTRNAPAWPMYKASDGEFYVVGLLDGRVKAYRLTPDAPMLACEVNLQPPDPSKHESAAVRDASAAVGALMRAVGEMYQGAGECGSGKFHWLRSESGSDALSRTLYQPWAMTELLGPNAGTDVHRRGDHDDDEYNLEQWSLGGAEEFRKYARYRQQLELTTAELGRLYRETFGWSSAQAQEIAVAVLRDAIDRNFAFSSYGPATAERELRQAILERQPLLAIKALSLAGIGEPSRDAWPPEESILNVAIEYPEALQYLLEKGFDPNSTNGFGKTPLMYAAQHDQIEAARMLLAAGADPNIATYLPEETCYYTISRSGMTALHYAARYASAPMIRLLVAAGAATFSKANLDPYSDAGDYPVQWLERYAANHSDAKPFPPSDAPNTRIAPDELMQLLVLLRVPNDEERKGMSADALTLAQEAYGRSDFKHAYRHVKFAVAAQPDNEKALADLALMAMKAGDNHRALAAARQLIESSPSVALQASAWFNMGLLCEQDSVRQTLSYRGDMCDSDWLRSFAQAWKLQPSAARAKKLRQVFDKKGATTCAATDRKGDRKVWLVTTGYGAHRVDRIYILGPSTKEPAIAPSSKPLQVIDRLNLGEQTLTVLEGPSIGVIPKLDDQACGSGK